MVRGAPIDETFEPVNRINSEIGKRIRARRHELEMTQVELARQVGVSQQQIVKYEKGIGRIPADKWIALGTLLQLDTASLYRPLGGLDVEISGFAEGDATPFVVEAFGDRDTVDLVRAFGAIEDKAVRKKVLELVTALANPTVLPVKATGPKRAKGGSQRRPDGKSQFDGKGS